MFKMRKWDNVKMCIKCERWKCESNVKINRCDTLFFSLSPSDISGIL